MSRSRRSISAPWGSRTRSLAKFPKPRGFELTSLHTIRFGPGSRPLRSRVHLL